MIAVLLILIPLLSGCISFFLKGENQARVWALLSSLITAGVCLVGLTYMKSDAQWSADYQWIPSLGSRFAVGGDGLGKLLALLTAVSFPIIFIATYKTSYVRASQFFGLMLLSQAGLMGVFLAVDALLFYFFWELALIPAYFLCSIWGGERRIPVTFKFFIYTFIASLMMLVATQE